MGMVGDQGSAMVDDRIWVGYWVSGMVGDQGSAAVEYVICICCNVYIRLGSGTGWLGGNVFNYGAGGPGSILALL